MCWMRSPCADRGPLITAALAPHASTSLPTSRRSPPGPCSNHHTQPAQAAPTTPPSRAHEPPPAHPTVRDEPVERGPCRTTTPSTQPSQSVLSSFLLTSHFSQLTPSLCHPEVPQGIPPSSRAPARTALWPRLRAAWDPPPPPAPNLPNGARPACRRGRVSDPPATLAVSSVPNQAAPPTASPTQQTADTQPVSAPVLSLQPPAAHAAASCTSESTPQSACSARCRACR